MQTSNFQAMKFTAQKWGGGPSWSTLPKSHLPDSKVWTIKGTPFEKLDVNLKKAGYRFPWFRNEVWVYYIHKQNRPFESAMGRHIVPGFCLFLAYRLLEKLEKRRKAKIFPKIAKKTLKPSKSSWNPLKLPKFLQKTRQKTRPFKKIDFDVWNSFFNSVFMKWQKSHTTESPAKTTHTLSRLDTCSHRWCSITKCKFSFSTKIC